MKITLTDTFNNSLISTHRTIAAAVARRIKHAKAVRRANGANSYVTYSIKSDDGIDIRYDVDAEEHRQQGF
jgi:hypothetical protein